MFLLFLCILVFFLFVNVCWQFYPAGIATRLWLRNHRVSLERLLIEAGTDLRVVDWDRPYCNACDDNPQAIAARRPSVYARTGIDCAAMFHGDRKEMDQAKEYMSTFTQQVLTPSDYVNMTSHCIEFRRARGYFARPLSQEEAEFPIAFSILVYKDIHQVERLLRAIYMPQNFYCIHIDTKAPPEILEAFEALVSCFDNVFLASRLENVYWGHISIIYAEMHCIEDLLKYKWKYFINLSGQMFPTHSNRDLVRILKLYDGANDVEGSYERSAHIWLQIRNLVSWRRSDHLNMMLMTIYPKGYPPYNITIYKGSNQVVMTRSFALYFLYSKVSQDVIEWFRDTYAPDEYIWPTLNHNPQLHAPGSFKGDPEKKIFTARATIWSMFSLQVDWSWKHWVCQGKWVREICIFGVGDMPWLYERPELFVNKFHSDFQWIGYDCMEELIFNRTLASVRDPPLNTTYYENLTFVRNKTALVVSVNETLAHLRRSNS